MESFLKIGRLKKAVKCVMCSRNLMNCRVLGYPHDGGEFVNGVRLWLFVECPRCRYQNSFRKLGVTALDI